MDTCGKQIYDRIVEAKGAKFDLALVSTDDVNPQYYQQLDSYFNQRTICDIKLDRPFSEHSKPRLMRAMSKAPAFVFLMSPSMFHQHGDSVRTMSELAKEMTKRCYFLYVE